MPAKKAVVLLNFGGPQSLDEVQNFLFEILRDPNVIQLPFPVKLQDIFADKISKKRSPEVEDQYEALGGKSPIVEATEKQRAALEVQCRRHDSNISVWVAHRYLSGHSELVVKELIGQHVEQVYLVPMYPHFSYTTTGSSFEQFYQLMKALGYEGQLQILRSYPEAVEYIDALESTIRTAIEHHELQTEGTLVLFSAHGLPESYVRQGDPYLTELQQTMEALRLRLPDWKLQLSFQSRVGPAAWLKPYTDELIPELPKQGVQNLLFVPISFVNDHLETLYEVGVTYFDLARSVGVVPYRANAIEDHPAYIQMLVQKVLAWDAGHQGLKLEPYLPPSQQTQRVDRWLFAGWFFFFLMALYYAV